ncbi:MAG: immunity 8 family protein [Deltaproteobacteria bacterium]|nr:immunity 8 family protein [Deltaproteobacteria bacterium]
MKPVIHGVGTFEHPNLRTFDPDDPGDVAIILEVDIGRRKGKGSDSFALQVVTPRGIARLPVREDGTITSGRILVVPEYDFDFVWIWLESVVEQCTADSWEGCVEKLRRKFDWEFEGYREWR